MSTKKRYSHNKLAANTMPQGGLFEQVNDTSSNNSSITKRNIEDSNGPIVGEFVLNRFVNKETFFVISKIKPKNLDIPGNLPKQYHKYWNPYNLYVKGKSVLLTDGTKGLFEFYGKWELNPKFGLQFSFSSASEVLPEDINELRAFLESGRLPFIGKSTAEKIISTFGEKTFFILDNEPHRLVEISGITEEKVGEIAAAWEKKKKMYRLNSFFSIYDVGETTVEKIYLHFNGNKKYSALFSDSDIIAFFKKNPYILCEIDGMGFLTVDKIAKKVGVKDDDPNRIAAFLVYMIEDFSVKNGHTGCPTNVWLKNASQVLGISSKKIGGIAQKLIDDKKIIIRNLAVNEKLFFDHYYSKNNDELKIMQCVSSYWDAQNEIEIGQRLAAICEHKIDLTEAQVVLKNEVLSDVFEQLDEYQFLAIDGITKNKVSVLTGGPGTGKTTTLKSVLDVYERMGLRCVLMAPTGRAAKRMKEATGRFASTIHRMLAYDGSGFNTETILGDVFVVDESSMIDNRLGAALLKAIPDSGRVLFIGDIKQLPSVGAGAFLNDLIQSKVCKTYELAKVHRQAAGSKIAEAATEIIHEKLPVLGGNPVKDDFTFIDVDKRMTNDEINQFIFEKIKSLVSEYIAAGYQKSDIQILSPQREGVVGVKNLNLMLQPILNESDVFVMDEESDFCVGDRLLITKNNYDKKIFNGDMGVVTNKVNKGVSLDIEGGEALKVDLEGESLSALQLGYAITVHKSQGGEKPIIIMPISPSHTFSMNKNLIYTGITRGKDKVVLVGSSKTLKNVIKKSHKTYRLTGLVQNIRREYKRLKMAKLHNNDCEPSSGDVKNTGASVSKKAISP